MLVSKIGTFVTAVSVLEMNYKTDLCKFEENEFGELECLPVFAGRVKNSIGRVHKLRNEIFDLYTKTQKNNPSLLESEEFVNANKLYIKKKSRLV